MANSPPPPEPDAELDLRGLDCPLPILKTKKRLATMTAGAILRVQATDPHAVIDFTGFCDRSEHELVDHEEAAGVFTFRLRCGPRC